MAKNVNHIQHVRSSALEENLPKLPNASALLEGELAVNYAADKEVLATKNSSGEVITFSSDKYYTEKKLGDLFSGDTTVTDVILDNEQVIATALNDLNSRKLDASAYTPTDLSNYYTKSETYSKTEVDNLIPSVDGYFDGAEYNSNDKKIYFKHGNDVISAATIDATDFIKDGMVSSAYTSAVTDSETSAVTNYLMIEFNTDASGETIAINLDEIIDPDNYYTKQQIDDAEMVVSAALNDLESRKLDASAYTPTDLSDYYTKYEIDEISSGHLTTAKFEEKLGSGFTGENSATTITEVIERNELVTSAALNDLNTKVGSGFSTSSITDVVSTTVLGLNTLFDTYVSKQEFENKIGSSFTGSNSATTITSYLDDKELVISSALNDLNAKKLDASAYTAFDPTDYYNKEEIDDLVGSGFSESSITDVLNDVIDGIDESDLVISAALNDLNSRINEVSGSAVTDLSNYYTKAQVDGLIPSVDGYFDGVSYDSDSHIITFSHSGSSAATLDATDFIKDGMVSSAYTSAVTDSQTSAVTNYIMIEFNTDAGKDTIAINVDEIIDPENYYTKQQIDDSELVISSALNDLETRKLDASALTEAVSDFVTSEDLEDYATNDSLSAYVLTTEFEEKLGSGFTGANSANTITKVIIDNELVVSAALNDLNARVNELSGNSVTLDSTVTSGSTNGVTSQGIYNAIEAAKPTIDDEFSYSASSSSTNAVEAQAIMSYLNGKELVIAAALTELDGRMNTVSGDIETLIEDQITVDNVFDEEHSSGSSNPVAASALCEYITEIELGTSSALNDLNTRLGGKQDTLVSGTNIKTINGVSLLGEGNITIQGGGGGSSLPNADVLSSITQSQVNGWNTASAQTHTHSNKSALDNLTQAVITNSHTHTNKSVLDGIDSTKVTSWDNAATSAHNHSNKSVLDGITSTKVSNWDAAYTSAHTHANKSVLDNLTQGVIDDSHTHTNKSALDTVTSQKITNWDNAYTSAHSHSNISALNNLTQGVIDNSHSHTNKTVIDGISSTDITSWNTVTAKTDTTAFTAHTGDTDIHVTTAQTNTWNNKQDAISDLASIRTSAATRADWNANSGVAQILNKPSIPTSLSDITSAHTHSISDVTNLQTRLNEKVSGITVNNGSKVTPTNGVINITVPVSAADVNALPTGTTLDNIADGSTRKLSNYATTGSLNTHSATTIPSATSSQMHLPTVSAADNGKILMVVNGQWTLVSPTTIYTGSGDPGSGTGNDGDIYLQTS